MATRAKQIAIAVVIGGALALGVWLRIRWLGFRSADMTILLVWYDYLALGSGIDALRFRIAPYAPPYLYALAAVVQLRETLLQSLSPVIAIKLPALILDAVAAWRMYALVRLRRGVAASLAAAALMWLAPTVWMNSAIWGQCDVFYAAFVVWSLGAVIQRRALLGAGAFGAALAIKAQAAFAGPVMLYLWLKRRMGLREIAVGALVFLAALAPAVAVGAPAQSTLLAYLGQADEYSSLSLLAPNLYVLIPDNLLDYATVAGLVLTLVVSVAFSVAAARYGGDVTPGGILGIAVFAAALAPFTLPRMHERYFYLADVIAVAFAFYRPRYFWVPLVMQFTSGNAYLQYFDLTAPGVFPAPVLTGGAPGIVNLGLLMALGVTFLRERFSRLAPPLRSELKRALLAGGAALIVAFAGLAAAAPVFWQPSPAMGLAETRRARRPVAIQYGDAIEIVGIDYVQDRWQRGRSYDLRIHARALKPLATDLSLNVEVYDALGRSLGISLAPGLELPTSRWVPGRVFVIQTLMPVYPSTVAPTLTTFGFQWFEPGSSMSLRSVCDGAPCDGKVEGPPIELSMDDTRPLRGAPLARFGDAADLAAVKLTGPLSGTLAVTLVWRAQREAPATLVEYVHVFSADNRLVGQSDGVANDGRFPAPAWRAGQYVPSLRQVRLASDLAPGAYRVVVGLYRPDDQRRLPVSAFGSVASADDQVEVGAFTIGGAP